MIHPYRRLMLWPLLAAVVLMLAARPSSAQQDRPKHLSFQLRVEPMDPFSELNQAGRATSKEITVRPGEEFYLVIEGKPDEGWYTYPVNKLAPGQPAGQLAKLQILSRDFVPVGPVEESEPKLTTHPVLGSYYKYEGPFTWKMPILVHPKAEQGKAVDLQLKITAQVCKSNCIIETHQLSYPLTVGTSPEKPSLTPEQEKAIKAHDAELAKPSTPEGPDTATPTGEFDWQQYTIVDVGMETKSTGLWGLIVAAAIGGLLSLVTPCVFPMIPITVSFFLKRSEAGSGKAFLMAFAYSGTLVLVLTLGGIILGSVLQTVSQHWITNVVLTLVFLFFGLSLMGMFDITLPAWMSDLTASREGSGGLVGIMFMALTFSIISFACVGPIYGSFTALSATSTSAVEGWTARIVGPLVFSVTFAAPFFLLALFPRLLQTLPKSGGWMNTVKVILGFLELAAAFKFVRAAEVNLISPTQYFTFDLVLGIYVALCVAAALYLFGMYRLPHDHEPSEHVSVPALVVGLVFLSMAFYLFPGTTKDEKGRSQKPRGTAYEWVRAFLLPDDPMEWSSDLAAALAKAERENKPLFIDFTGQTCNNCKLNESTIFSQPKVEKAFLDFVTVSLYTDTVPGGVKQVPDARSATLFRDVKFGNIALPYYVVLRPKGKTLYRVAAYDQGLIGSADEFLRFLDEARKVKIP